MNKNNGVQFVGIVACVPKGDWQSNLTYGLLNIVRHNGASYIATTTVPANNEPSLNSKYWNLLVKDGENGSGSSITIDDFLSLTSTNPVQNKVIALALNEKQAILVSGVNIKTINNQSILGEGNLEIDEITVDKVLSPTSTNPVENQAVTKGLNSKADEWVGAIGGYSTYRYRLHTSSGEITGTTRGCNRPLNSAIALFSPTGTLKTKTPEDPLDCVNKEYFDNAIANKSGTKWYKHNIFVNIQNVTYFNMQIITTSQTAIEYNGNGLVIQGAVIGTMYYGASGSTSNELQQVGILLPFAETYYPTMIVFGSSGLPEIKDFLGGIFPSDVTEFIDTPTEL